MFYDIFLSLCNQSGKKPGRVAEECGFSRASVNKWKSGSVPSTTSLNKIAEYFDVSTDFLLGKEEKPVSDETDELNEYLEELKNRPEMRMLFSLAKGATKEDVERAVKIIEALRK